ncbi:tetratricopeptide repeat protein [Verrucomicrobiales bacterium]|nr:tetratricopeptide repeat protein [Verrucomicrobiales bacterium]
MRYLISIFFACCVGFSSVAEEPNQKAGKYHSMLEKRPSSGYLFDRFYNAWLDTGSIEGLGDFLKKETKSDDAALGDRLLLAWFFAKQGEDAGALEVFKQALKEAPENAEAWFEKAKIEAVAELKTVNVTVLDKPTKKTFEQLAKSLNYTPPKTKP